MVVENQYREEWSENENIESPPYSERLAPDGNRHQSTPAMRLYASSS